MFIYPFLVLAKRFPKGVKTTWYKRTLVEEFAPYVQTDGLITKISRFNDMDCSVDQLNIIEEIYANRHDCMNKIMRDINTGMVCEYFTEGRDDAVKSKDYFV